jgi:hypothetical protein
MQYQSTLFIQLLNDKTQSPIRGVIIRPHHGQYHSFTEVGQCPDISHHPGGDDFQHLKVNVHNPPKKRTFNNTNSLPSRKLTVCELENHHLA